MNPNLEDAVIKAEELKGKVSEFIEHRLAHLTISSDATDLIIEYFRSLVMLVDLSLNTLIDLDRINAEYRELQRREIERLRNESRYPTNDDDEPGETPPAD